MDLHTSSNTYNEDFRRFSPTVDFALLFDQIKGVISLAKITPAYNVFDTYIFHYPFVGYDEEGILDYIQVLAYSDINGIHILEISPYRVQRYKKYVNDLVDLEYQKEYLESMTSLSREKM